MCIFCNGGVGQLSDRIDVGCRNLEETPDLSGSTITELNLNSCPKLRKLGPLPPTLTDLYCSDNVMDNLPLLSVSLTSLFCGYNFIREIRVLPPNLRRLGIAGTRISRLPVLPPTLNILDCRECDELIVIRCNQSTAMSVPNRLA
jgi:Leucine-rich repeat (LRR) protein